MSPKPIDPISPSQKASAESAESIIPRNADSAQVLAEAKSRLESAKEEQSRSRRRLLFWGLLAGLIIFLVGAGVIAYKALEDKKLAEDEYAVIEGRSIKQSEFEALRDAYIRYDQQKGQSDKRISERRAADELMTRVGLEVRAEKYGIGVTQDDIDSYLAPAYLQYGSRDGLLRYNQHLYGWDEKPLYHKAKLDLLKQKLQSKIIAEMDLLGVYIRWDNHMDKSEEFQKEYGRKAVERLEKDYLPRLNGGQVAGDFIKTTDVNASLPVELNNERLNKTDDPIVRYLELKSAVNDPKNDPFQHGQKASDAKSAWAEIEKLEKVGDTTPVFKSDSGMYLALRIERKSEGEYISYESYLKKAIQEGKVDSSYNELPIPDNGRNILPTPTSSADVSLLAKFLPKATASGSRDCWAQDPLQYEMRPADGSAGYASITNNPFTVLVVRSGSDTCIPYNGFGYFMNAQGRQAWTSPNVQHGMVIPLNCYGVVWDFAWSAPSGYQGFTAGDYQAPNRILTGFGSGLVWAPSDISGLWRNANIYYGIANGAGRYAVAPIFYPDAPPPPPPPLYNITGWKADRYGNATPQVAGAVVRDTSVGDSSATQPFTLNGRNQAQDHIVQAQDTPDWTATGWELVNNGTSGNQNYYGFPASSTPVNSTQSMIFRYEPRPSSVRAGILVKDPSTGALSNPCTQSGYQNVPCSSGTNVTLQRTFNLPPGLVNSYSNATMSQTTSNGAATYGGLYTGSYTATASGIPAGWQIVGTYQCSDNADPSNCFPADGAGVSPNSNGVMPIWIEANRSRPVFYVLQPNQMALKGDKKGPGTFTSTQNSDTTNLGVGTIMVGAQTVSGNNQAGAWNAPLNFNPSSGAYSVRAVAPAGWRIRGYAFCASASALSSCASNDAVLAPNNQTQGQLILGGNDTTDYSLNIDYTNPDGQARFNGVVIPAGGQLWVTFFFKPAPVTIQVRGKIDMQGGNGTANTDLNPCAFNDYKRNLCTQTELQPVRMNTRGLPITSNPTMIDIDDPAGASGGGACASKDYVPTKPGYNYGSFASSGFYCTNEGGNGSITQAKFITGNSPLRYGMTLDARTGGVGNNTNPAENNLAIVRNVYPGKYSFQMKGLPQYNGEDAYNVAQATCAPNQLDCSMSTAPINNVDGCLLNHRRQAEYTAVTYFLWWPIYTPIVAPYNASALNDPAGQNYCTIMWSGAPGADNWPSGGTPQSWNISAQRPRQCLLTNGVWAYNPQWNAGTGSYGIDASGTSPCGYRKDAKTTGPNTFTMGLPIDTGFREQVFYYSPKILATNTNLTCDNYSATVVFMPDPSRPVTTYYRFGRYGQPATTTLMRTDSSTGGDVMLATTQTSGSNAHQIRIDIPKYNGQGGELLKDGDRRSFEVYARYGDSSSNSPDGDLVNGYGSERDWGSAFGSWKYAPARISSLTHQCQNNATCDQASFNNQLNAIAIMDADDPQANTIDVTVTNTGHSFWQQNVNENGASITTGHELTVTGGTLLAASINDSRGWYIAGPDYRMADGTQVYPVALNPSASTYKFTMHINPPKDGGSKFTLGFQMRQYKPSSGYTEVFGTACEGQMEIKVSYKPWYRVQNGNVTALGEIRDQPESARGMYKAENRTNNNPYPGSVDNVAKLKTDSAKPVMNLHAQFSVVAEGGGTNFCSTNFYMLGIADPPNSFTPNASQQSRKCSFGGMDLNIPQAEDSNGDGTKELKNDQLIVTANNAYRDNGQCVDVGSNPEDDGGPYELSAPTKYYRSWESAPYDVPSLKWSTEQKPNNSDDGPFGRHASGNPAERGLYLVNITNNPLHRPCPTIFKLDTPSNPSNQFVQSGYRRLGGFIYGAGRSTILSDQTIYITDNITVSIPASPPYSFQRNGVPDMAGLNAVPNLGIISEGDIVVASNVERIDASLYAKGRIITCDQYVPNSGLNEDAGKTDQPGSTGTKWIRRGAGIGLDSNPLASETTDPNVIEAPNTDNAEAKKCANRLKITGSVTGGSGFTLGRNHIDFSEMVQRWGNNEGGAFGGQSPQEFGKFCNLSDVIGIRRVCNLYGVRKDFDSPDNTGATYWLAEKAGWPQNYYTGGPAEDFVGNGISSFMPPPGFENISTSAQTAKYYKNTARPRF